MNPKVQEELQKIIIENLFPYWNNLCNNKDYPEVILSRGAFNIASAILSAGYVKLSDVEIDEEKLEKLINKEISDSIGSARCVVAISTHSQQILKVKE